MISRISWRDLSMKNNLQSVKLGELLISLKTGLNPRDNFNLNTQDATNWYITVRELNGMGVDFLPQTDRVNNIGLKLINNRSNLEIGDVLFSGTGTIGKTAIIDKTPTNWNIKEGVYSLKPKKDKLDSYYLLYLLKQLTELKVFNKISAGSTVFSVPMKSLEGLTIKIPKLHEQAKISSVLKALDFKIGINNKINTELEAMAKLIYDYWFVQFDFPDQNGKPYKSSGGKMVWNEELKREIPEGWKTTTLSKIANIIMGQSPPGSSYNQDGIGTIFYQGSTDFGKRYPIIRQYTSSPSRLAKPGDILLSVRAPVGDMNIANHNCCIGRGLAALNSKIGAQGFLYEVMKYFKQVFDLRNGNGTTFGSITKEDLYSLPLAYPSDDLVMKFEKIVWPMYMKQNLIETENQKLIELRDWLLPMLMNGQVKVSE